MLIFQKGCYLFCFCFVLFKLVGFAVQWLSRNLLPEARDGIEVALSVSHLALALGRAIQLVHVAVGGSA